MFATQRIKANIGSFDEIGRNNDERPCRCRGRRRCCLNHGFNVDEEAIAYYLSGTVCEITVR